MKNINFSPPDISEDEIKEVTEALRSGWITTGPRTKEFERKIAEFIGVNKAVCLNSATAAMELTLHLLGVGPGDEVITSAYTYSASAAVIHHVGAKIILVDTAPGSFEMDYDEMEKAINANTKVIIPVDIAGVMCNYDRIFEAIENKKHLFIPNNKRQENIGRVTVLSDAAHSFGACQNGKNAGQVADVTCFSFHAVKNLTTAEGGAITWTKTFGMTDEEIYNEYMLLSLHGQSKDALSKMQKGSWEYDIIYPAYKCNMTDILAAVGLVQLQRYKELLKKRFDLIKHYEMTIDREKFDIIYHHEDSYTSSGHLFLVNIKNASVEVRNKVIKYMAEHGIATNVHYKPLPLFTAYKNLGFDIKDYPNAFNKYKNEITLPLHTLMSVKDVFYVAETLNNYFKNEV
ncbi:MAG: DegT/DnrJ/EryC1/StrS aminotransferase family protein [Firmicutes bacterium]|nr:DegT/DnrJ/EryC1/StrS aminotransferase family protein [Bacillota bacterium]